jgi:hypothetical protein
MFAPWTWPAVCGCLCAYGAVIARWAWTSPKSRAHRARNTTNHKTTRGTR